MSDRLVEFADGEVFADDHRRMAEHLLQCPACRDELRQLERSLQLAKAEWRLAAHPATPATAPTRSRHWPSIAARAAACIVCLLAAGAFWLRGVKPIAGPIKVVVHNESVTLKPMTAGEINDYISRQERVARLAVAVKVLASQPGLECYASRAKQYMTAIGEATPVQQ